MRSTVGSPAAQGFRDGHRCDEWLMNITTCLFDVRAFRLRQLHD